MTGPITDADGLRARMAALLTQEAVGASRRSAWWKLVMLGVVCGAYYVKLSSESRAPWPTLMVAMVFMAGPVRKLTTLRPREAVSLSAEEVQDAWRAADGCSRCGGYVLASEGSCPTCGVGRMELSRVLLLSVIAVVSFTLVYAFVEWQH
jgi:hypothetical protein